MELSREGILSSKGNERKKERGSTITAATTLEAMTQRVKPTSPEIPLKSRQRRKEEAKTMTDFEAGPMIVKQAKIALKYGMSSRQSSLYEATPKRNLQLTQGCTLKHTIIRRAAGKKGVMIPSVIRPRGTPVSHGASSLPGEITINDVATQPRAPEAIDSEKQNLESQMTQNVKVNESRIFTIGSERQILYQDQQTAPKEEKEEEAEPPNIIGRSSS